MNNEPLPVPLPNPLLTRLPDANRRSLVRAATRLLGPTEAEDAVQDAYLRALEANTLQLNSAQAWLLTVVRNLAIDRLRRRHWLQQWLMAEVNRPGDVQSTPSAEMEAALAQEAAHAVRLLAAHLAPEDGAAVLLHAVFDVTHGEIAQASGRSEASSRQQLRRALLRLRQIGNAPDAPPQTEPEPGQETVLRLYLQALQLRDPHLLWAMLRPTPVSALARMPAVVNHAPCTPVASTNSVLQVGGQLCLVFTLDGVILCVLPLGAHAEHAQVLAA